MDFTATIRFDENHVLKVVLTEDFELSAVVIDEGENDTHTYTCTENALM